MHYLRISDSNAYTRISEALSYINETDNFSDNTVISEITEELHSYRYSSVDMTELEQRFFGELSESYAYSGNHIYNLLTKFVYRKENIYNERSDSAANEHYERDIPDNAASVINAGDSDYSYINEDLTYKTENILSENGDIQNVHNSSPL